MEVQEYNMLKQLIASINKNYRYYLGQHTGSLTDTVLYATERNI